MVYVLTTILYCRRFNLYILNYCNKRGYTGTAHELQREAGIDPGSVPPIDARQGLLFEYVSFYVRSLQPGTSPARTRCGYTRNICLWRPPGLWEYIQGTNWGFCVCGAARWAARR